MNCEKIQEWLLRSDLPQAGAMPADVAGHLAGCAACRLVAKKLRRMETAARELPQPAGADAAREAFLARLKSGAAVRPPARRTLAARLLRWSAAAAALVLLATAVGLWLLSPGGTQTAEASTALDELVEWNLELADAPSAADRGRLYSTKAEKMRQLARGDRLSADDHELAAALVANSERLSHDSDPMTDAEGFTDIAGVLVQHIGKAVKRGDAKNLKHLTKCYGRVLQGGINARLEKLDAAGPASPDRDRNLERLVHRHAELREQLTALLKEAPDASDKDIRRALALPAPKHRKGK
ncbi:MAG: hypothetical protein NT049_15005 [Planctomycetota bacterium]|nr:hypothetical protein [Planctomycetota bacterium]